MVSEEMTYLMENKEDLEEKYAGKYIAIYHKKVVAMSKTIHEIYKILKELDIKNPLVTYIPQKNEGAFLI